MKFVVIAALSLSFGLGCVVASAQETLAGKGKLSTATFAESELFPGTTREYSVYVPAKYLPDSPAKLMVLMDGKDYVKPNGPFRVTRVLDQLIQDGEIPVTIAVFVNPGTIPATKLGAKKAKQSIV